MEGIAQAAASRLADYKRDRPEAVIWTETRGTWHGRIPPSDSILHGRTVDELLAKLDGASP
jgi:hypothetical protein